MLEHITRLTKPSVAGQFYLVPTVRAIWFGKIADWPVIGPLHEDIAFFNFGWVHYHIDARFLPARYPHVDRVFTSPLHVIGAQPPLPPAVLRRRKCVRVHVPFSPPWNRNINPLYALRAHYGGQQCAAGKHGWICPHRKASLGSIQPDEAGVITCPLHGLRIDARSGIVLPNR